MLKSAKDGRGLWNAPSVWECVDLLKGFSDGSAGMVLLSRNLPDALFLNIVGSANGFVVYHNNHLRSLLSLAGTTLALTIAEKLAGGSLLHCPNYITWVPFQLSKRDPVGPYWISQNNRGQRSKNRERGKSTERHDRNNAPLIVHLNKYTQYLFHFQVKTRRIFHSENVECKLEI